MNEPCDHSQQKDHPVVSPHLCIDTDWIYSRPIVGLNEEGLPIFMDSWKNDKVKRNINNEKENI